RPDAGVDGRSGTRRHLRAGRRSVHGAAAAIDCLARTAARRRVRRGRHSENPVEPDASERLFHRRRLLGRLRAAGTGAVRRADAPARPVVHRRQDSSAHLRALSPPTGGRRVAHDVGTKGDGKSGTDRIMTRLPEACMMHRLLAALSVAVTAAGSAIATASNGTPCANLAALTIPGVTIKSAAPVAAGA